MEVTVQEAKTQLSRLLRRVEAGEEVVIRRGRERVAMLVRLPPSTSTRTIWGELRGALAPDFDELPPDFDRHAAAATLSAGCAPPCARAAAAPPARSTRARRRSRRS